LEVLVALGLLCRPEPRARRILRTLVAASPHRSSDYVRAPPTSRSTQIANRVVALSIERHVRYGVILATNVDTKVKTTDRKPVDTLVIGTK
jgi:hypothetical protein